jgi:hypothetical protein
MPDHESNGKPDRPTVEALARVLLRLAREDRAAAKAHAGKGVLYV